MGKTKRQYSDEDKAAALLALEANGGNLKRTARETGIPLMTIRNWREGLGTPAAVTEIGNEKRPELIDRLMREIHLAVDQMAYARSDASYADLSRTIGIFIDKVQLLNGGATEIVEVKGYVSFSPEEWDNAKTEGD